MQLHYIATLHNMTLLSKKQGELHWLHCNDSCKYVVHNTTTAFDFIVLDLLQLHQMVTAIRVALAGSSEEASDMQPAGAFKICDPANATVCQFWLAETDSPQVSQCPSHARRRMPAHRLQHWRLRGG